MLRCTPAGAPPVHGGVHVEPAARGVQRARAVTTGAIEPQVRCLRKPPPGTTSEGGPEFESPTSINWLLLAAVREDGRLADPSDLLDGAAHGVLLDDDGAPDLEKVKAAISELLARRPHYAKRIGGDVGQGARPGQAERGAMGIIQSRTRQIRCYWYRWIIEGGMTKS
jgi:hypothetical protein